MASLTTGYKKKAHVKKYLISVLLILWAYNSVFAANFELNIKEKQWLDKLPPLRVGVSNSWLPINFKGDDATHQGIASDYMKLVSKKLGLTLKSTFGTWQELQSKIKAGEIDLLPSVAFSKEKVAYLDFTEAYLDMPTIIATRIDAPHYPHIDNLKEVIVGVGENFAIHARLKQDYPEINTRGYTTIEDAVLALDSGEIDALVTNATVYTYFQNKHRLKTSIHINNTTQYTDKIAIGVRHELAPLVPLLNRALADISDDERDLIVDKWANLNIRHHIDWTLAWQLALPVAIFVLLIFYSNRKMSAEIVKRKEYEEKIVSQQKQLLALWGISSMLDASIKEICDRVLAEIVELTESPYGFYGFLDEHEDVMTIHSWSEQAMNECVVHNQPLKFPIEKSGIWGNAIRSRRPFILNDYQKECANKKGVPEGHVTLTRVMSVPIIVDGKILALGAVANKKTEYQDEDANQLLAFLNSAQILVQRNQLQSSLRDSEGYYRLLFEEAAHGTAIADVATGEIISCNRKLAEMIGRTVEEIIGQHQSFIHFPPDSSMMESQSYSKHMRDEEGKVIEDQLFHKNGHFIDVEIVANQLDVSGKKVLHGVFYDISERKKLMEEYRRSAQLAALGTIAAGVAHEINNPIQGIMNCASLIARSLENKDRVSDLSQKILGESKRVAKITQDLLYYSKDARIEMKESDISQIIGGALTLISTKIKHQGISLQVEIQKNLPLVTIQPQSMQQVILNLIDNAADALEEKQDSPDGKVIEVKVFLNEENSNNGIEIDVIDNGCGMAKDVMSRALEAFYTTKPSSKGTGLGLSIVNDLVNKNGGKLFIESEEGVYTKISIIIPLPRAAHKVRH